MPDSETCHLLSPDLDIVILIQTTFHPGLSSKLCHPSGDFKVPIAQEEFLKTKRTVRLGSGDDGECVSPRYRGSLLEELFRGTSPCLILHLTF